jgi:hypothetical protein
LLLLSKLFATAEGLESLVLLLFWLFCATKLLALDKRLALWPDGLLSPAKALFCYVIIILKFKARMLNLTDRLAPPNSSSPSMKSSSTYSKSESEFDAF